MQERFSKFPFLKFRIPHFAFPNQITPSRLYPDSVGALRPWREPISRPHAKSATFAKDFSDQKNNPSRLYPDSVGALRPWRESSAFSLTEVVIAMGVAAVAFTSIIALFPLGLNMSRESYEATQAALIAQTIMADLKDQQTGATNLRTANPQNARLFQITPNSDPMGVQTNYAEISIGTGTPQTAYIAYKPSDGATNDTDPNNPLIMRPYTYSYTEDSATAPNWYNDGTNGAFALVKVTISPTFISDTGGVIGPRRIDMSIETPGSANVSNRTCYLFTGAVKE
jgi:type II secretory pathway pseudopilin PulG